MTACRPRDRAQLDRPGRARRRADRSRRSLVDGGRIVAVVPDGGGRRATIAPRETIALPSHVLLPGPRQRAHACGDDALARHRRRRAAQPGSSSTSGRARRKFVDAGLRATTARVSAAPRCCAAASPAATTCTSIPDAAARAYHAAGMRAMLGAADPRLPDAVCAPTPTRYLRAGLAARDALQARADACVRARAARAVHGRRRDVREDRRCTRASSTCRSRRICRNRRGSRRRARPPPARSPLAPARPARRDRAPASSPFTRVHLDARRHRAARAHRLPRRALPDVEHEARERHRARRGAAARAASTWRSGPTARRPTTGIDLFARDAARRAARQGRDRRRRRRCPRSRRSRWRRSTARARSASSERSARSSPGKEADLIAVDLSASSTHARATIRSRTSSTSPGRETRHRRVGARR